MLQKTDEVKDLNPDTLELTLVSTAEGDKVVRRFRFANKEDFAAWSHALMDAIQNSEKRTKQGTLLQLMKAPSTAATHSAEL